LKQAFSIDVEEYFHTVNFESVIDRRDWSTIPSRVELGMGRLLDALVATGSSATCFVLGIVADRHPQLVRRIAEAGVEIASHGFDHRRVSQLEPESFAEDLRQAEESIGAACGLRVRGFRAPHFSIDRDRAWALDVLIDRGYVFDSSIFPGRHPEYGVPEAPTTPFRWIGSSGGSLIEVPVAVLEFGGMRLPFAGGGYLRMLPYALFRAGLKAIARRARTPFTVYCHPWELDPDQPRPGLRGTRCFRHYVGLERMESKIYQLLREFPFGSVSEVVSGLDLPEMLIAPRS